MPFLGRLRAAGFGIWPFEDARPPLVVEIWPRALTGPVTKSRRGDRARVLAGFDEIGEPLRGVAASTDDIFDAAASAAVMWRSADRLRALAAEPDYGLEGKIWTS
jgi:hypothetical protein